MHVEGAWNAWLELLLKISLFSSSLDGSKFEETNLLKIDQKNWKSRNCLESKKRSLIQVIQAISSTFNFIKVSLFLPSFIDISGGRLCKGLCKEGKNRSNLGKRLGFNYIEFKRWQRRLGSVLYPWFCFERNRQWTNWNIDSRSQWPHSPVQDS